MSVEMSTEERVNVRFVYWAPVKGLTLMCGELNLAWTVLFRQIDFDEVCNFHAFEDLLCFLKVFSKPSHFTACYSFEPPCEMQCQGMQSQMPVSVTERSRFN